jgi:tetratricopeptide (TPR) repeat protein
MPLNPSTDLQTLRSRALVALIVALALLSARVKSARAQPTPQAADKLLSQAIELAEANDYVGAERVYREALLAAPDNPEILRALGVVCQKQLKYKESLEAFQQILKRAPLYPGVNHLLGISYYALGEFDKAAEAENQELVGNPHDRQAQYYLALALSASGHIFEAIQQLEGLMAEGHPDAEVLYQLVVDYRAATQQAGERLASLYPDSEFTHAIDAEVYADNQRFDEAIREFQEVLRKDPHFPGIHFALGQTYWRKKDSDNTMEQLKLALQEDPGQPLANFYLADILTSQKEFESAIPHLQITIAAYRKLTQAYFLLGKCYAGTGDLPRALESFKKALEQDPNYKEVHYQLSELYARLGDKQKSQAELQIFQKLTKEGQEKDRTLLQENYLKQKAVDSFN